MAHLIISNQDKYVPCYTSEGGQKDILRSIPLHGDQLFKKCCISNALDGTEDDFIWEEENVEQSEDDYSDDEDMHNDRLTDSDWQELFGNSDDDNDEDFDGF